MLLSSKTALVYGASGAVGGAVAPVDAADAHGVAEHLERVAKNHGAVQIMFNAVGLDDTQGQALTEMPFDRFLAPIVTGMKTWFHTGTALARHMASKKSAPKVSASAASVHRVPPMRPASAKFLSSMLRNAE